MLQMKIFKLFKFPLHRHFFFTRLKIIYLNYVLNIADLIFLNSRVPNIPTRREIFEGVTFYCFTNFPAQNLFECEMKVYEYKNSKMCEQLSFIERYVRRFLYKKSMLTKNFRFISKETSFETNEHAIWFHGCNGHVTQVPTTLKKKEMRHGK